MAIRTYYMKDSIGFVFETSHPEMHKDAVRITKKEGEARRKEQSRAALLQIVKPGQTVATVLRHVSRSGMQRRISLYVSDGADMRCIDHHAATVTGHKESEKGGLVVSGCGMDMGFALVYDLGAALWPNGTKEPHSSRNGEPDCDGGYALRHRWL